MSHHSIPVHHEIDSAPQTPDLDYSSDDQAPVNQHLATFPRWMLELQGQTIHNRVVLEHIIGCGTFGVVYVATGTKRRYGGGRVLAVKVLSMLGIGHQQCRQIDNEIYCHRLVAAHPNIVTIHDYIEDLSSLYIVMDACQDGDLFKCIVEDELYVGNDEMIKDVFVQLLDAVEFCHSKGVYHRDLKPENILCRDGGNRVLLTDFGLATRDRVSREFGCGSVFYMSPECMGFTETGDYSTSHNDIWALGVILVNMITCRNPWGKPDVKDTGFGQFYLNSPKYLRSTLPLAPEAASLVRRILAPTPSQRLSIKRMRKAIALIPRFLLTPAAAAHTPNSAYTSAHALYAIMAARRPQLLLDHYEDICLYYPEVAGILCENLRSSLIENRIIDGLDDLFFDGEEPMETVGGLPEWAQPVTFELNPERLDNLDDYPQSPKMSRDDSSGTLVTTGPITPASHPTHVADNVPVAILDDVDQAGDVVDQAKVSDNASPRVEPFSPSIFANAIGLRIAAWFQQGFGVEQ